MAFSETRTGPAEQAHYSNKLPGRMPGDTGACRGRLDSAFLNRACAFWALEGMKQVPTAFAHELPLIGAPCIVQANQHVVCQRELQAQHITQHL
jgi:hypothetical protein